MKNCEMHDHDFLHTHQLGERRTLQVLMITLVTMGVEIVAGFLFNSMALTADGWHMATHAAAFGITIFAYRYARKHAHDPRFSFGTGKVSVLGGFASAVGLVVVSVLMVVESLHRLIIPEPIRFEEAIGVAVLGLLVNLASAWLLKDAHHHGHDHGHDHEPDHNLKAAYFHVLADALTSITAIIALTLGRFFGWVILDPLMGMVGALIISRWAVGLIRETSGILLDGSAGPDTLNEIRSAVERNGESHITDLHVWAVAPGHHAVILSVNAPADWTPETVKKHLAPIPHLTHISVEIHSI